MDTPMVAIDVWRNEITVARDHPAPVRVRDDVELIMRRTVAELGEVLGAYLDRCKDEVILIRRFELDFDLDVACDPTEAARALARRLTLQLIDCIETDAPQILRFPSQAAYRARFIADLATGNAWGRWYYAAFDGLRVLPPSAAIRTLLTDDDALETLAAIAETQWQSLTDGLSDADLWRVLDALAARPATSDGADVAAALRDAIGRASLRAIGRPSALALALLATLARQGCGVGAIAVASTEIVALTITAFRRGNRALLDTLTRRDAFERRSIPGDATAIARTLTRMAGSEGETLRALAHSTCARLGAATATAAATADLPIMHASCAPGLIVLFDEIDALFEAGLASCLPIAPNSDMSAEVRAAATLAVLACAAGPAQAQAVWHDAAWRTMLGLSAHLSWADFVALLATRCDPVEAREAFAQHAIRYLRAPVIRVRCRDKPALRASLDNGVKPVGIGRIELAVDAASDLWCAQRVIAHHRQRIDDSAAFDARTVAGAGEIGPASFAQRLAITRATQRDWYDLDNPLLRDACPPAWRALFTACAQFTWRRITQRVPGTLRATLPYLRANLLGRHGGCEARGPDHWHWRVARPPLHVLITMTGLSRCARTRYCGREKRIDVEWI
jgi:hypothetical protein